MLSFQSSALASRTDASDRFSSCFLTIDINEHVRRVKIELNFNGVLLSVLTSISPDETYFPHQTHPERRAWEQRSSFGSTLRGNEKKALMLGNPTKTTVSIKKEVEAESQACDEGENTRSSLSQHDRVGVDEKPKTDPSLSRSSF